MKTTLEAYLELARRAGHWSRTAQESKRQKNRSRYQWELGVAEGYEAAARFLRTDLLVETPGGVQAMAINNGLQFPAKLP